MAVNYYLTPVFHIVFRDLNSEPLIGGRVRFSKASNHAVRKAVYEDKAGTIPFPDPLILNDAGIVADGTGAPKPIYWASDEDYYVEVYSEANWPNPLSNPTGPPVQTVDNYNSSLADFPAPTIEESNLTNYMLNPQFRYFEKQNLANTDLPDSQEVPIAEEGWFFYRDTNNSTNQIDYVEFSAGQTDVPYNPKYYLKFECTVSGAETRKDICLPFKDVITFSGESMSFAVWGRSLTGNPENIQLVMRQFFGSGGSSVVATVIETFTLATTWSKLSKENFIIPSVSGKTIGSQGDDKLEVCLRMPLNKITNLGIVNNQLNQGEILFDFNYVSPEEELIRKKAYELPNGTDDDFGHQLTWDGSDFVFVDDTGRVETYALKDLPPYSLPMEGQTVKRLDDVPNSNNKVKYDRLYQKWEGDSGISNGNAFGYGEDGFFPQNYTNNAIFINVKDGSVTDWADNDTGFTFSKIQDVTDYRFLADLTINEEIIRVTNKNNGSVTDATPGTTSFNISIIAQGTPSTPEITHITCTEGSLITGGQYFTLNSTTTAYYFWYEVDGVGVDPAIGGKTGIQIDVLSTYSLNKVADTTNIVLKSIADWTAIISEEAGISVECKDTGPANNPPTPGTTQFVVYEKQTGKVGPPAVPALTEVLVRQVSSLSGGEYFLISNTTTDYYVWFKKDGVGADPAVATRTGILIEITSTDTNDTVATLVKYALLGRKFTKIQTLAASTLSGGEYFLAYNVGTQFYVWFTIDGTGTDPAVGGKEGIKIELTGSDTANQVATKLAKQLSSYYYIIPDIRGYFLRNWNNGSQNDPDASFRRGADNIQIGDKVGTFQAGEFESHNHPPDTEDLPGDIPYAFAVEVRNGGTEWDGGGFGSATPTTGNRGGLETRPINFYVRYAIKY